MPQSNLKQQKTFTTIRVVGGLSAAVVLGYSTFSNWLAGAPLKGPLLGVALLTLAAIAYAGFFTWKLGKLVEEEGKQ